MSVNSLDVEVHCFTDASQKAYAACIYIKSNGQVNLLCAKSRVAPLKLEMTIPRLELLGALHLKFQFQSPSSGLTQQLSWDGSRLNLRP